MNNKIAEVLVEFIQDFTNKKTIKQDEDGGDSNDRYQAKRRNSMNYSITRQAGKLIANAIYPTFPLYRKDGLVYKLRYTEAGGLVLSTQTYDTDRWFFLLMHNLSHAALVKMATEVDVAHHSTISPTILKEDINTIIHTFEIHSDQRIISGHEFLNSGKWAHVLYDISALIKWNGREWEITTEDEQPDLHLVSRMIQDAAISHGVLISDILWVVNEVQERLREHYEDLAERNPKAHRKLLERKEWS